MESAVIRILEMMLVGNGLVKTFYVDCNFNSRKCLVHITFSN